MKTATCFWLWLLRYVGHAAVTLPWKTIYCLPGRENDAALLKHEKEGHVMQIERDGAILWTLKTWYYALRYSREMNPYEVEARTISGIS